VDPQERDVQAYAEFAKAKGIEIKYVIDTHIQADHRSSGRSLSERTGAPYCLHTSADVSFAFTPLTDAQELVLGSVTVKVISGKPMSTLVFEKRWNPVLNLDRIAFIEKMTTGMPPRPAQMESILRANEGRV